MQVSLKCLSADYSTSTKADKIDELLNSCGKSKIDKK